jgi:hypothetical protein
MPQRQKQSQTVNISIDKPSKKGRAKKRLMPKKVPIGPIINTGPFLTYGGVTQTPGVSKVAPTPFTADNPLVIQVQPAAKEPRYLGEQPMAYDNMFDRDNNSMSSIGGSYQDNDYASIPGDFENNQHSINSARVPLGSTTMSASTESFYSAPPPSAEYIDQISNISLLTPTNTPYEQAEFK